MDTETGGDGGDHEIKKIQQKFRLKKAEFFDCEKQGMDIMNVIALQFLYES